MYLKDRNKLIDNTNIDNNAKQHGKTSYTGEMTKNNNMTETIKHKQADYVLKFLKYTTHVKKNLIHNFLSDFFSRILVPVEGVFDDRLPSFWRY